MIKHFTRDQKRIYDEWRDQKAGSMTAQQFEKEMDNLEKMFAAAFGGGKN